MHVQSLYEFLLQAYTQYISSPSHVTNGDIVNVTIVEFRHLLDDTCYEGKVKYITRLTDVRSLLSICSREICF